MKKQNVTLVKTAARCWTYANNNKIQKGHSYLIQVTSHILSLVLFCLQLGQSFSELGFQLESEQDKIAWQ